MSSKAPRQRRRSAGPSESPSVLETAFGYFLQRRPLFVLTSILAAVAALGLALRFGSEKHTYFGRLMYTPNRATMPYYSPPDLGHIVEVANLPRTYETIQRKFALDDSLDDLQRQIRIEAIGDATVSVVVRRPRADQAEAITNKVIDLIADAADRFRKDALSRLVVSFENDASDARAEYVASTDRVDTLLSEHGYRTTEQLREEIEVLRREASAYEQQLRLATVSQRQAAAQRSRLAATLSIDSPNAESPALADAVEARGAEPAAFLRPIDVERRNFLREQLQKRQADATRAVTRRLKQQAYDRAKSLHARQLISDAALEKARGELESVLALDAGDASTLRGQIDEIDERLTRAIASPNGLLNADAMQPAPGLQAVALLEGSEEANRFTIGLLEEVVAAKKVDLAEATDLLASTRSLVEEAEAAEQEWVRLESARNVLTQTAQSTAPEFVVTQRATATVDGVSSNHAKVFGAAFVGLSLLGLLPALVLDVRRARGLAEANRSFNDVPLLGRTGHASAYRRGLDAAIDRYDLLAVRVLSVAGERPAVIVVACEDETIDHRQVTTGLAESCSRTGESVALLDFTPLGNGRRPSETRVAEAEASESTSRAIATEPGAPGTTKMVVIDPLLDDSQRVVNRHQLVVTNGRLRDTHSLILLVAPKGAAAQQESLASVADGAVWVAGRRAIGSPDLVANMDRLDRAGAPAIGVIGAW